MVIVVEMWGRCVDAWGVPETQGVVTKQDLAPLQIWLIEFDSTGIYG